MAISIADQDSRHLTKSKRTGMRCLCHRWLERCQPHSMTSSKQHHRISILQTLFTMLLYRFRNAIWHCSFPFGKNVGGFFHSVLKDPQVSFEIPTTHISYGPKDSMNCHFGQEPSKNLPTHMLFLQHDSWISCLTYIIQE